MLIRLDTPLPCAQYATTALCAQPTTLAVISPLEGGAWEILPVCPAHLQEADRPAHRHALTGAVLTGRSGEAAPLAPATAD